MKYLNQSVIKELDAQAYQTTAPYPWLGIPGFIQAERYQALLDSMPETTLFDENFGHKRKFGQASHDRLALEYHSGLALSPAWKEFMQELTSDHYKQFIKRMTGMNRIDLRFHWHYTPRGCSVSPHCDAMRKIGSHIFYFNTTEEWQAEWGGDTLILDDGGEFKRQSSPKFSDFKSAQRANATGNNSLLFSRNGNSWHGVEEITCPEGQYRKVFIVVVNKLSFRRSLRNIFSR